VPITADTLIAGMHFGGVEGTAKFLATGGKYNPTDGPNGSGTSLSNYMLRVAGTKQQLQQAQQVAPPQPAASPEDAYALARGIMSGQISQPTPQQAMAAAPILARLPIPGAQEMSKRLLDYGLAGPQAAQVSQAQAQNQAPPGFMRTPNGGMQAIPGYVEATNQVEGAKPVTLRGEGSAYINPLHPERNIQIPVERTVTDPQTGAKTTIMVEPLEMGKGGATAAQQGGAGGAPAGAPGNAATAAINGPGVVGSFPSGMAPGREELVKGLGKDYVEESKKEYSSAMMTAGWAEQMDHAMDVLNQGGGWSVTGSGNPERMEVAKMTNGLFQTLGMAPPFDANKVASWEEFTKQTKTAGMQLVNSMFGGSREAASIINGATSAVPNSENTPVGGKLVLNGIKESSNYVVDRHIFETNWQSQHGGSLIGAEEAFNQQYSPAKYAKRAISQVQPYTVDDPSKLKAFLPGTRIMTPGGLKVIPGPEMLPLGNVQ